LADGEESTLLIVKPDAVRRGLIGEILSRVERKGLRIDAMRLMRVEVDVAQHHYQEHAQKPFFDELVEFITGGDVVVAKLTGRDAVSVLRTLMGATDPAKSAPGTIRGDFGILITENLVHGSDSAESAARELSLFFPEMVPLHARVHMHENDRRDQG
jgi:nucleoside-diphosphate kinase